MLASEEVVKAFHLNPFTRLHAAAFTLENDKAVALAERAEDVRALVSGGAHFQLAFSVARQNTALEIKTAR